MSFCFISLGSEVKNQKWNFNADPDHLLGPSFKATPANLSTTSMTADGYAVTPTLLISTMSSDGISSVEVYTIELRKLLSRAKSIKASGGIEPALTASEFEGGIEALGELSENGIAANNQVHYAAIETACRNLFYDLLVRQVIHTDLRRSLIMKGIHLNR